MGRFNCFVNGALLGVGALYFFDPQLGRRRRALLEDQFRRFSRKASEGLDAALRDLNNRAQGTVAELQQLVSHEQVADDVLCQRIRSLAGRYVSNAAALNVDVADGCVCLSGQVHADEAGPLARAVRMARGVCSVDNQLELHESAGNLSSPQGSRRRAGELPELLQANWAPGTRLVAGTAGSLMMLNCMVSRSIGSKLWGLLGFALASRALASPPTMGRSHKTPISQQQQERQRSSEISNDDRPERGSAGPSPWPSSSAKPSISGEASASASSGRMSSGNEDRPDVWPQSRAVSQSGISLPFTDQ